MLEKLQERIKYLEQQAQQAHNNVLILKKNLDDALIHAHQITGHLNEAIMMNKELTIVDENIQQSKLYEDKQIIKPEDC